MCVKGKHRTAIRTIALLAIVWSATTALSAQSPPPKTAAEYYSAGLALQLAGEQEKALEQYRAALKLEPKHFGAQVNSGVSHLILEKYESAVDAFKAAASINPSE